MICEQKTLSLLLPDLAPQAQYHFKATKIQPPNFPTLKPPSSSGPPRLCGRYLSSAPLRDIFLQYSPSSSSYSAPLRENLLSPSAPLVATSSPFGVNPSPAQLSSPPQRLSASAGMEVNTDIGCA
ncbi:hypothetical protein BH09VER1_BH09VER1_40170 [soil metagenome]